MDRGGGWVTSKEENEIMISWEEYAIIFASLRQLTNSQDGAWPVDNAARLFLWRFFCGAGCIGPPTARVAKFQQFPSWIGENGVSRAS